MMCIWYNYPIIAEGIDVMKKTTRMIVVLIILLTIFPLTMCTHGEATPPAQKIVSETTETDEAIESDILLKLGDEGDDVVMLQERLKDLGYYQYKTVNNYDVMTMNGVLAFQKNNNLPETGELDQSTHDILFSTKAKRMPPTIASLRKGELLIWEEVQERLSLDEVFKAYDVETGIAIYMKRTGGENHAYVEPITTKDTVAFKKAIGNEWCETYRAMVVRVDGQYIAASITCSPEGDSTIEDNDMDGYVRLYFVGSTTDDGEADEDHQAMIKKAAGIN